MTRYCLLALMLAVTACGEPDARPTPAAADLPLKGTKTLAPMPRPDMVLTDTDGRPYDFKAATEGTIALLFFGYTYCPDVCPIHMATLASALAELDPEARSEIVTVFVSVDPERDTPERLRSWLDAFDTTFVGLRGTEEELAAALDFFRYPPPEHSDDGPVYTVGHPALIYGYTPDGLAHVMYGAETPKAVWKHDLAMMAGYPWGDEPDGSDDSVEGMGAPVARVGDVVILDAYAPEPPPGSAAALYLTLRNDGAVDDTLMAVAAEVAARVSLHATVERDGLTRMESVSAIPLPAGEIVRLAPGAFHGMLEGMAPGALTAGGTVEVTLTLAGGRTGRVPVRVVRYQDLPGA